LFPFLFSSCRLIILDQDVSKEINKKLVSSIFSPAVRSTETIARYAEYVCQPSSHSVQRKQDCQRNDGNDKAILNSSCATLRICEASLKTGPKAQDHPHSTIL
jgi:hypothetical protein